MKQNAKSTRIYKPPPAAPFVEGPEVALEPCGLDSQRSCSLLGNLEVRGCGGRGGDGTLGQAAT